MTLVDAVNICAVLMVIMAIASCVVCYPIVVKRYKLERELKKKHDK